METRGLADLQAGGRAAVDRPAVGEPEKKKPPVRVWFLLVWAGVIGLMYLALKDTPLAGIVQVLRRLEAGQILLLAAANLAFLVLVNARWALLLHSLGWKIPFPTLMLYRMAGFGISYVTPGPQFGGEPVQVHLLHRQHDIPLSTAVTSVLLDRLVDLLANFSFLFVGCLTILLTGLVSGWQGSAMWLLALGLLLLPAGHLAALSQNRQPVTWLLGRMRLRWRFLVRLHRLVGQSEGQIAGLVREKPLTLMGMIGLSVLAWGGAVLEFWLCLRFLGVATGGAETISALTAARLAFLLPLPGGLGALEASQTLAARLLGWESAVGFALSLVIRARDVLLALIGLGLGGFVYRTFLIRGFFRERR